MKKSIKRSGLVYGDRVIMVGCSEAEKYKDKVWTTRSDPWDVGDSEVILLSGKTGGFATEFLKKVQNA